MLGWFDEMKMSGAVSWVWKHNLIKVSCCKLKKSVTLEILIQLLGDSDH